MPITAKPVSEERSLKKNSAGTQRQCVSVRLSAAEKSLIKSYAEAQRRSVSDVIRLITLEKIEDEYDLKLFIKAKEEYLKNPNTVTHAEMMKKYGLHE